MVLALALSSPVFSVGNSPCVLLGVVYINQWSLCGDKEGGFAFSLHSDYGTVLTVESDAKSERFEMRGEKVGWQKAGGKFTPTVIGDKFSALATVEVSGAIPDAVALFPSLMPCLPGEWLCVCVCLKRCVLCRVV
jgi:hypothetical protein